MRTITQNPVLETVEMYRGVAYNSEYLASNARQILRLAKTLSEGTTSRTVLTELLQRLAIKEVAGNAEGVTEWTSSAEFYAGAGYEQDGYVLANRRGIARAARQYVADVERDREARTDELRNRCMIELIYST